MDFLFQSCAIQWTEIAPLYNLWNVLFAFVLFLPSVCVYSSHQQSTSAAQTSAAQSSDAQSSAQSSASTSAAQSSASTSAAQTSASTSAAQTSAASTSSHWQSVRDLQWRCFPYITISFMWFCIDLLNVSFIDPVDFIFL